MTHRQEYLILVIVVAAILFFIFQVEKRELRTDGTRPGADGNGDLYYLGRGNENDSVEDLLDRIEWSTYLEKRISYWARAFIIAVIIVLLLIILVFKKFPSASEIVLLILLAFIPVYATRQFFYTHGDVYNDYYIKTNVGLIREKLGLKRGIPPEPDNNIPDRPFVMNGTR